MLSENCLSSKLLPKGMSCRFVQLVLVLLVGVTLFLLLDHQELLPSLSNTAVLRSIPSPRLPLMSATPAAQSSQRYSLEDIVAVPLEPYNACGDRILHVSCLKTIIIDSGAVDMTSPLIPTVSSLYPQLCEDLVQQTKNDLSSTKQLDDAHCMLCLQVDGVVSALAEATKMKDKINRYLLPTEASRVAAAIVPAAGGVITYRIVDRKTIAMSQTYRPSSMEHNRQRQYESNFGNLIWQYGATRLINPFTTLFVPTTASPWTASAVVMASANSLWLDKLPPWHEANAAFTQKLRSWDVPTIMLGIGIQKEFSSNFSESDLRLFDYQRDLLQEIEKRQSRPAIAVRGHLTRITCENAGVSHCITMGCPSLTINTATNLGSTMQQKWKTLLNKLADGERVKIGLALPATPGRLDHKEVMELFARLAKVHDVVTILQTPKQGELKDIAKELGMMEHARAVEFYNVEEWFNQTANVDLVISARIHGGMAGIASATPTVIIPMDWRIQELVDAMLIPSLPLELINSDMDLGMLLRQANVDFKAFEANRRKRLLQYTEILREADLEMNPKLLDVVYGNGPSDSELYD